jgi:FixJ family two-component response regulator
MVASATVFVVDDGKAFRESLVRLLASAGLNAKGYASAKAFLEEYDPQEPGCLVLDLRMPGMSGLELQRELKRRGLELPVILLSGHGNVEVAVGAMRAGAVDFVRKPYHAQELLERIRHALAMDAGRRRSLVERTGVTKRFSALTPREFEIVARMVAGDPPKEIAHALGISRKTVDVHRGHIMSKLQADSLVELMRLARIQGVVG